MSDNCQGCRDLEFVIGGENQMSHYGGCLDNPEEDDFLVPTGKRRKTTTDEIERKSFQFAALRREIDALDDKIKELSKIPENYIEKIYQLEITENKIKELSAVTTQLEEEMKKLSLEI